MWVTTACTNALNLLQVRLPLRSAFGRGKGCHRRIILLNNRDIGIKVYGMNMLLKSRHRTGEHGFLRQDVHFVQTVHQTSSKRREPVIAPVDILAEVHSSGPKVRQHLLKGNALLLDRVTSIINQYVYTL